VGSRALEFWGERTSGSLTFYGDDDRGLPSMCPQSSSYAVCPHRAGYFQETGLSDAVTAMLADQKERETAGGQQSGRQLQCTAQRACYQRRLLQPAVGPPAPARGATIHSTHRSENWNTNRQGRALVKKCGWTGATSLLGTTRFCRMAISPAVEAYYRRYMRIENEGRNNHIMANIQKFKKEKMASYSKIRSQHSGDMSQQQLHTLSAWTHPLKSTADDQRD